MNDKEVKHNLLYGIDDKPPLVETAILGLQHYLTMFGSTLAIPLLVAPALGITDPVEKGWLIATMFFVSGITTLLQTTWGNRLPIVQGGTFSFLAPTFAICGMAALANSGWEVRIQHVQGAIIAGSLVEIAVGATDWWAGFSVSLDPLPLPLPLPSLDCLFLNLALPWRDHTGPLAG